MPGGMRVVTVMPTNRSKAMPRFPDGRRFAFTIIDDTDVATLQNIRPVYELLAELGMRTTKTVWPLACPEGSVDYHQSETLEDPEYRAYVLSLRDRGFELSWHAATMESSLRERTLEGFERFREIVGYPPRVHANHAYNRENLYWGVDRLDDRILRRLFLPFTGVPEDFYAGHREGSPYWWGDLAREVVTYARNLTFTEIDTLAVNPSMPYADPRRPLARWWFSASDAEDVDAFVTLLSDANLDRLERRGSACIVATHIGKRFAPGGVLDPRVEERLRALAKRSGWFVPVSTLLDHLRTQRPETPISDSEWRGMQWRWARDTLKQQWRARLARLLRA